jgi:hypothetical protein
MCSWDGTIKAEFLLELTSSGLFFKGDDVSLLQRLHQEDCQKSVFHSWKLVQASYLSRFGNLQMATVNALCECFDPKKENESSSQFQGASDC